MAAPIGVAEYRTVVLDALLTGLAEALPTTGEIEERIGRVVDDEEDGRG